MEWKFRVYVNPGGRNKVQQTIARYDDYAQEQFSRRIAHLATTPKNQWDVPDAKKLKNEDPLYEIRYKAQNRAERALGYFAPDGETFIILLICSHKDKVYTPPDAFKSAHNNIRQIENGSASTVPLKIHGEDFPSDDEESGSP